MSLVTRNDDFDLDMPIGTRLLAVDGRLMSSADQNRVRGGSVDGLSFELVWKDGASAALTLLVSGRTVSAWEGSLADLSGFLRRLAASWDALLFEETYPLGVVPKRPTRMVHEVSLAFQREDEDDGGDNADSAASELTRAFEDAHNVGSWLTGGRDALWLVRQASEVVIDTGSDLVFWPFFDVVRTLTKLGNDIADRLKLLGVPHIAIEVWEARESSRDEIEVFSVALGMPVQNTEYLLEKGVVTLPRRVDLLRGLNDLQAAARMLGAYVDLDDLASVIESLRTIPKIESEKLNSLGDEARKELRKFEETQSPLPYQQGHHLADWLRGRLGLNNEDGPVDPKALLFEWGIPVDWITLDSRIEAVSVWSDERGPAVLINREGTRSRKNPEHNVLGGGARATLAHEICHLLVDRGRSLPVLEVFGGATPKLLEQRANAFAAEFLLPLDTAMSVYSNSPTVQMALQRLTRTYQVTYSLTARQILNAFRIRNTWICRPDEQYLNHVSRRW